MVEAALPVELVVGLVRLVRQMLSALVMVVVEEEPRIQVQVE
jgi:hypothetical protein